METVSWEVCREEASGRGVIDGCFKNIPQTEQPELTGLDEKWGEKSITPVPETPTLASWPRTIYVMLPDLHPSLRFPLLRGLPISPSRGLPMASDRSVWQCHNVQENRLP